MKAKWDERYSKEDYAYGTSPNVFFKEIIDTHGIEGKILMPADGEGRNGVYAATKGLEVYAFDISIEGKKKALKLAKEENVTISYEVGDFFDLPLAKGKYDAAALIYAHFPTAILSKYHKKVAELIVPGGLVILEAFCKGHLELRKKDPKVGGPDKAEMLFSKEMIKDDFSDFEILQLKEIKIKLHEGEFHQGIGKVIRFLGKKKSV